MATTTAGIFEDTSAAGSFMLPGMGSPEQASCGRVVRFDSECVLIPKSSPTRSKLPVVLTKSYSLPLWKRKSHQFSDSDVEDAAGSSAQPQSPEDNRVTIKVPIPTFRRSSRSPTPRTRSISSSPTIERSLPSCLVHRSPSVLAPNSLKPLSPVRRPSIPIYHRRRDELTIPLRDCCADCERITEECLKEGDGWKEKFSRGARRRRSASLDYIGPSMTTPTSSHTITANLTRAFTPFSTEGSTSRDLTSRFPTTFAITVDEVDKRKKYSMEDTDFIRTLSPPVGAHPPRSPSQLSHPSASLFASSSGSSRYPQIKPRDRELSSSSTASLMSTTDESLPIPDIFDPRNRLRSSPIEEEDETQLFPLPRRSRSNTPSPSPSPKVSPAPSPNGSTSSLPIVGIPLYLSPISSKQNSSSSQESILSNSLSRKVENGHLAAPTVSMARSLKIDASSTVSSPFPRPKRMRGPICELNIPEAPAAEERTSTVSPKENKPSSAIQVPFTISPSATTPDEISDQNTTPLLAPPTLNGSSTDNTPKNNAVFASFEPAKLEIAATLSEPANSTKAPSSPNTLSNHTQSPITRSPLQQKAKLSFTLPFIKAGGTIRDVGADVLKGVASLSSGGGGGGAIGGIGI